MSVYRYAGRGVCLLLAIVSVVSPVEAQSIRGTVVHQDGATRAQGIVVLVVDRDNRVAGRALTSASGTFDVKLHSAGAYAVRALRIGFRPTDVGPFEVAADSAPVVRVVLRGDPMALDVVSVTGRPSCRNTGDGTAVAAAWLQARTALTAAAITAESDAFVSRYQTWERVADDQDSVVTSQRSNVSESTRPRVFISAPADTLARVGYAFLANGEFVFLGPDADVLLSDQFAAAHCFQLGPSPDRDPSRIAIEFQPAGRRSGYVDVRGRLILDRATSELRSLEFSYHGLPRDVKAKDAGGRVRFTRVPDGAWIVSHWALRIPTMEIEGTAENLDRARATIRQVRETGGEILQVTRESHVVYEARRRTIAGRLMDSLGVGPASGRVGLVGTLTERAVAADGAFRFEDVVPGRYRLTTSSAPLDSLGLPTELGTVDVRDSSAVAVTIRLPSSASVYRAACKREDEHAAMATGLVRGVVRDAGGNVVPGATVRVQFLLADTVGSRVIPRPGRRLMIETALDGSFQYCRVPRGSRLKVAAMDGERALVEVEVVLPRTMAYVMVELRTPSQVP